MSAILTNTMTSGLLVIVFFSCFLGALIHRLRGNSYFTRLIVIVFFTLFMLTIMSSLAHFYTDRLPTDLLNHLWIAIGVGIVFLNYSLVYAIKIPDSIRILVVLMSLMFLYFFVIFNEYFFIALSIIFCYTLAAIYSYQSTRVAFIAIIVSNLIWIILREGANYELGYTLPPMYRYDNDIYHLLLIVSTFMLYKSIKEGDWSYPDERRTQ